jgi:hypothetical protein
MTTIAYNKKIYYLCVTINNLNVSQISSGIYIVKILFTDGYSITKK